MIPTAIALFIVGVALVAWAYLNPKWQHQDAYDAIGPLIGGFVLIALSVLVVIAWGLVKWWRS